MENEKSLMRLYFGDAYKACKASGANDDRQLFINMVNRVMEALNEMEKVENNMIKLGFSWQFDAEVMELEDLKISLTERGMI